MLGQHTPRKFPRWLTLGLPTGAGIFILTICLWLASTTPVAVHADPINPPEGYPKYINSIKVVSPSLVNTGGMTLTYWIEIQNTGAYTGYDTTLTDTLPAEVSYNGDAWASVDSEFVVSDGQLSWIGDVGFDSAVIISYSVTISPEFSGFVTNTAVISHPLAVEEVVLTAEAIVTDDPILTIEKTAEPLLPGPGKVITYYLSVGNIGQPAVSLPVTVTDRVPVSTTLEGTGPDGDPGLGEVVTWTRDISLETGEQTEFTFSVLVDDVISGTVITNDDYTVQGQGLTLTAGLPHTITVVSPDLLLWKEIRPDPPGSNRDLTYTLTLFNQGSLATGLVITDEVPAGVTYQEGGTYEDGVVSWDVPSLDTGEFTQVNFTVYISDVMGVPIFNGNYGACSAEGVCVAGIPVTHTVQGPHFKVTAEVDPIAKAPGGGTTPVTPTMTIHNLGPGNALDARADFAFERIQVSSTDLEVIPDKGTLSDGEKCGDKCVQYYWIGDLDVGETITITTIEGQNSVGGSEGTHYTATISITDTVGVSVTEPISAAGIGNVTHLAHLIPTKSGPPEIGADELLSYRIHVWNSGLSTDENETWVGQVLTETLPPSTTLVWASHDAVTQTVSDTTTISWTLPHLGPGAETEVFFTVLTDKNLEAGDLIINDQYGTLWYEASPINGFLSLLGEPVTTTIREVGLVDSFKTVTPTYHPVGEGRVLTFTVNIVNSGPHTLTGVTLYDTLPWENSTYQRDAIATAGEVISDIVSVEWSGDLLPYTTHLLTMTVVVDSGYEGPITNTAVISHTSLDNPVEVNAVAYISDKPILQISKQAAPESVELDEELLYTIHVVNLGARATLLNVYDQLPSNGSFVANSATANGLLSGDQVQWLIPLLDPGQSKELSFRVIVRSGPVITNGNYWVNSAEGASAQGAPVVTPVIGGGLYLPLIIK